MMLRRLANSARRLARQVRDRLLRFARYDVGHGAGCVCPECKQLRREGSWW